MDKIAIILLTCFFTACSATAQQTNQDTTDFDCIRGEPEPSLDSIIYPTRQFRILNKTSAIETVDLKNGDKIIIRHWGCEYFVQTYRFETTRFQADTADILFWYKKTVKLLREIEQANQSPIDIKAGLNAMINYIDTYTEKHLGEEIDFVDSIIRQFVTLDRIEQLDINRFGIEVTYAIGPL